MYTVGQKVRIVRGAHKGKRGVVTAAHDHYGWCNIRTNKGIDLSVVPYNVIVPR